MTVVSAYKRNITKSQADVVAALTDLKTLITDFSPALSVANTDATAEMTVHHKSIMAVGELIKKLHS